MTIASPKTDKEWEARNDAETVARAAEIKADKKRWAAAQRASEILADEKREEAKRLEGFAKILKGQG